MQSDGGRTWGPLEHIYEEGGDREITIGNPCPVVDQQTGVIWLPFTRDNDDVFITSSDDDGKTWRRPQQITSQVKRKNWSWYATGPGNGIQLQKGSHRDCEPTIRTPDHSTRSDCLNPSLEFRLSRPRSSSGPTPPATANRRPPRCCHPLHGTAASSPRHLPTQRRRQAKHRPTAQRRETQTCQTPPVKRSGQREATSSATRRL